MKLMGLLHTQRIQIKAEKTRKRNCTLHESMQIQLFFSKLAYYCQTPRRYSLNGVSLRAPNSCHPFNHFSQIVI